MPRWLAASRNTNGSMRIIGGALKGYSLKAIKGLNIRPTSDMLREAIFSMLESMDVDWSRVLDLYAGSGAMGIESLSRGTEFVDFVEENPRVCALIKQNLEHTALAAQGKVHCMTVARSIGVLKGSYGVVFLDPPYADPAINAVMDKLASSGLVGQGSTVVLEHSKRVSPAESYGGFRQVKTRRHGDSSISIYRNVRSQS